MIDLLQFRRLEAEGEQEQEQEQPPEGTSLSLFDSRLPPPLRLP